MITCRAVVCDYNPSTWDIRASNGRLFRWGGALFGAVHEAMRIERALNDPTTDFGVSY
jgi:hypothetical protein